MEPVDDRRQVSVFLMAVQHDAVEFSVEKRLGEDSFPHEAIFWECRDRTPSEAIGSGHWGLEDAFHSAATFLRTMLLVLVWRWPSRPEDETSLGHGLFLERVGAQFAKGVRGDKSLWDAMPLWKQALYTMAETFFRRLCHAKKTKRGAMQLDNSITEFFAVTRRTSDARASRSRQPAALFKALVEDCTNRLQFIGCILQLDDDAMPALMEFLAGFEALLIENRESLAPPLGEAARILMEMSESAMHYDHQTNAAFTLCFSKMRDESNWAYVRAFLEENDEIDRVGLVVGSFHVFWLAIIIARQNAESGARGKGIRFVNVVEIGYRYDMPIGTTASVRDVRVESKEVLRKVGLWRQLSGY
jgi:hypothetical protein